MSEKSEDEDMGSYRYLRAGFINIFTALAVVATTSPVVADEFARFHGFWEQSKGTELHSASLAGAAFREEIPAEERHVRHRVRRGDTLWSIAHRYGDTVKDLKRRNGIGADSNIIVPGQKLVIVVGTPTGLASWYGDFFHGKPMANGVPFDMHDPTIAAHWTLPLGTRVLVRIPETGKTHVVTVQDRGPHPRLKRDFDLSMRAAEILGIKERGVAKVEYVVLETPNS